MKPLERLFDTARADPRHIILPEGDDPRVARAAALLAEGGLARVTLMNGPEIPGVTYAQIDESTGKVVTSGGRGMPFLPGTVPKGQRIEAGQVSTEDFLTGGH